MHSLAASSLMRVGGSRALLLVGSRGGTSRHLTTITTPSPLSTSPAPSPAPSSSSSLFHSPLFPTTTEYPAAWLMPPPPPPSHAPPALKDAFAHLAARRLARAEGGTPKEIKVDVRMKEGLSLGDFVARVRKEEKGEALEGEKKKVCIKGCPTCSKRK